MNMTFKDQVSSYFWQNNLWEIWIKSIQRDLSKAKNSDGFFER